MATLQQLAAAGKLTKLDVPLGRRQQEERVIYLAQDVVEWLRDELPVCASSWNIEETPEQQFDSLASIFVAGETITYDTQFKTLRPIERGIWELKTADLRIFGWFHRRDCFVVTRIDTAQRVKDYGLYPGYRDAAVRFRDGLSLDEPKYIQGDDPHAVVSAFDFT